MTKAGNALFLVLAALISADLAQGATAGSTGSAADPASAKDNSDADNNPYHGIVDRNVFGLKPIPPPAPPPEQPKPPVNITLTGISTLFNKKRCFITLMSPPKAGAPATPESKMLTEGERDGGIEIVSIDEKAGSVNLKDGDTALTISFKDNGVKGGPPPVANAGGAPMGNTHPGYQPSPFTPTAPGQKMIPGRPLRIPTPGQTGEPNGGSQTLTSPGLSPGYNNAGVTPQSQPQPQMSLEEAELMTEAQHTFAQQKGDPTAAMFPPTRLNPNRNTAGGMATDGSTSPNQSPQAPTLPVPPGGPRPFRP